MTFLLILVGLTLAMTVAGAAALLIRRTRLGRAPRAMAAIWAAVLVLAVVPLYLPVDLPAPTPSAPPTHPVGEASATPAQAVGEASVEPDSAEISATAQMPTTVLTRPAMVRSLAVYFVPAVCVVWVVGAVVMFTLPLLRNRRLSAMLCACSTPCDDTDLLAELTHLADRAGLREPPELRILDASLPLPPCTAGVRSPHIYLPNDLPADPNARAAILAHELCHIRRRDIARKLVALGVLSLHWFNPLAHALLPRLYEDIEPACDRDALALLGGERVRLPYMQTILDVARATRVPTTPATLFFVGGGQTKRTLERRFFAMKKTRYPHLTRLVTLTLVLALALLSAATFTACAELTGLEVHAAAGEGYASELTPLAERIVRYHYDLAPEDEITDEMLAGITSLKLSVADIDANLDQYRTAWAERAEEASREVDVLRTEAHWSDEVIDKASNALNVNDERLAALVALLEEKTLVHFTVNDSAYSDDPFAVVPANFFDATITGAMPAGSWDYMKLHAYYLHTQVDTATYTPERLEKYEESLAMIESLYAGATAKANYVCDPSANEVELALIVYLMSEYGILDPQLLDTTVIDTAALYAIFPNLDTIELVGLFAEDDVVTLEPLAERIARFYGNLAPDEPITKSLCAEITGLTLAVHPLLAVTEPAATLPAWAADSTLLVVAPTGARESDVDQAVAAAPEMSLAAIPARFFEQDILPRITDEGARAKFCAYFVRTETADGEAYYALDPEMTDRDTLAQLDVLYAAGFLDAQLVDRDTFPKYENVKVFCAQLEAAFPNLKATNITLLPDSAFPAH